MHAGIPIGLARRDHPLVARGRFLRTLGRYRTGTIGLVLVGLILLTALAAPILTPYDPAGQERGAELLGPSAHHPLGTDEYGRDLLTRMFYGGRASLLVGVLAVVVGAAVGVSAGLAAARYRGGVDALIMRVMDAVLVFPAILWSVAIIAAIGPGIRGLAIAAAVANIPQFARLVRASGLVEAQREYIEAARAIGVPPSRIVFRHLFPNILSPLIMQVTLAMAFAVQLEAGLSFLGLGVQVPTPSWGGMLSSARNYLGSAPWYGIGPGIMLALLLIGLNFAADGFRRAFDPRRAAEIR